LLDAANPAQEFMAADVRVPEMRHVANSSELMKNDGTLLRQEVLRLRSG
jgi:hypothetical protein